MGNISPNFNRGDFTCHCPRCGVDPLRPATRQEVIDDVQHIRDLLGEPLIIDRGVSCAAHNASVGGASDSRHLPQYADAVDFRATDSVQAYNIVRALVLQRRFTFIEVAKGHIHADQRPGLFHLICEGEA